MLKKKVKRIKKICLSFLHKKKLILFILQIKKNICLDVQLFFNCYFFKCI